MYGVPDNLDLTFLHGAEVIQVCLGQYQVQFHFHPKASISIEGNWKLLAADRTEVDRNKEPPRHDPYQLHRLLGQRVVDCQVCSPKWIALRFENGEMLQLFDDSEQYESFSIEPGNIVV